MEIPEIQYNPEQPSANFAPVQQVDSTAAIQANHAKAIQGMNQRLQQMDRNAAVKLQNAKDQAFPVEQLAQFSKTLEGFMQERIKEKKEDDLAEGAMLAFTEGVPDDPVFDENEKQIDKTGAAINRRADTYERKTGDIETAEQVRSLTGWKKYGYAKAQMEMAGKGFGAFMETNSGNEEFAVNVGGQPFTLSNAPNQAIRQAVAAKMAASYMKPYAGMNKAFLGKYLYPGMQMGMQGAVAGAAQAHAKLMKANRLDAAQAAFRGAPNPTSMMELDNTLRNDGYDNKTIRTYLTSEMVKVKGNAQFETLMRTPYGPNGKPFQEQYPQEASELRIKRQEFLSRGVQEREMARRTQDRIALEEAKQLVADDYSKDGELNARPERLTELAQQAKAAGNLSTAEYWEGQIADTAYMQNSSELKRQYEQQMMAGVIPSRDEILQNPGLSQDDKQALLGTVQSSGGSTPNTEMAAGHKSIIEDSIRKRGEWTRDGANDPGVAAMEMQALQEYNRVYNNEIQDGKTPEQAANAALSDFKANFNKEGGDYSLIKYGSPEAKENPSRVGKYAGYDPNGVSSTAVPAVTQFDQKAKEFGGANNAINNSTELYGGEQQALKNLERSFYTTGKVGNIPTLYYDLQQRYGGHVRMIDLINTRLNAAGLKPLPKELNDIIKPVEDTFDDETYRYVSYKPNTTRTDIGLISSGEEPIYRTSLPTNVASDQEFQVAVRDTAQRLGVSEADLISVMSFETGGSFDPGVRNAAGSGATGLIQFMPSTAAGLGTSTQALAGMSRAEQMQYVEKYLSNKGVKGKGLDDLYMAVLFPAAVGKPDNFVLFGNGAMSGYTGRAYQQNKGLDLNGDGSITKAEASAKVLRHRHANPWRRPNNMRPELQ